jgi:DNA-binding CsgD family transcriptional regulator
VIPHERPLDLLEAAYRLDGSDDDWIQNLVAIAGKVFAKTGLGVAGLLFTARSGPDARTQLDSVTNVKRQGVGIKPSWTTMVQAYPTSLAPEIQERMFLSGNIADVASETSGLGAALREHPNWRLYSGLDADLVGDALGLVGHDGGRRGLLVSAALPEPRPIAANELHFWQRVAIHLGTALRLRSAAGAAPDTADAVLSHKGRLLHVRDSEDADVVSHGFARRQQARSADASSEAALDIWQGLCDGRWSLIDYVDTDRRSFVLAVRNEPGRDVASSLSDRQRAVVALAALGYGNKQIAYALGLSQPAVAMLLRRARAATGARTRADLVRGFKRSLASDE